MTIEGLIASDVTVHGRTTSDRNGFVTALALRALHEQRRPAPTHMLDAIERCRSSTGGFRFWPMETRPPWAPDLPDDTDDTAIMVLELFRAGRFSLEQARRTACLTIGRHRIGALRDQGPPWRRMGVFRTWHRPGSGEDLIDCVVATNAVALFTALGLPRTPGVPESEEMVAAAVAWAGQDWDRAASLSPFYPDPAELVLALAHAVAAGADRLAPVHAMAAATPWGRDAGRRAGRADHAVCSSPYGEVVWRAPVLATLRQPPG